MPDKIFDVFRKLDRSVSTIKSMQRTAERVEFRTNKGGFIPIFVIAVVVAAVAAAGMGIYLYKKAMAAPESPALPKETQKETGRVGKMGFGCRNLLSDADLNRIGVSTGNFNFEEKQEANSSTCSYTGKENTQDFGYAIIWSLTWGPVVQDFEESKNYFPERITVTDVGSDAYYGELSAGPLAALSSNRKYGISVGVVGGIFRDPSENLNMAKEIAKIIDENLNRY